MHRSANRNLTMPEDYATLEAYGNGAAHLADELRWVDMRIASLLQRAARRSRFAGLVIAPDEIAEVMNQPSGLLEECVVDDDTAGFETRVRAAAQETSRNGVFLTLPELSAR